MSEISMPRLSDTMEEGTIARWLKSPGDEIKKGDILAEIETDKATMDLEAYEAGTLQQILVQEGETVPIGQAVALIGSGAVAPQPSQPAPAAAQTGANGAGATAPAAERPAQAETSTARPATTESGERGAAKASPLARRMAEEHSIDLNQISGTGPGGRIVRDDIEDVLGQRGAPAAPAPAAAPKPAAPPQAVPAAAAPPSAPPPDAELVKLSRVQMIIARRLTESKQTIPHFYVSSEVDMTDLLAMRQTLNANAGEGGVKVAVNDLIMKACALALEKFPEVNSALKDDHFIRYKRIHVGMA